MDDQKFKTICSWANKRLRKESTFVIHSDTFSRDTFDFDDLASDFFDEFKQWVDERKPGFAVEKESFSHASKTLFFDMRFSKISGDT